MNESTSEPDPESKGGSEQNKPKKKRDLVARMHKKRAEFADFRAQFAQFRRGYNNRLNEFYQFIYEMNEDFLSDLDELSRFKNDEYFNCNRQKPNETDLPHHLLYFLADARTDADRDKFMKPAAVLEFMRDQGVPARDVAQRLKAGGGYSGIYKNIRGKRAVVGDSSDDLDVLRQAPEPPDDYTSELPGTGDSASEAPCPENSKGDDTAQPAPAPIADQDGATPECGASTAASGGITGGVAAAAGINLKGNAISSEADTPKRKSRTRVNLANTVPVTIPHFDDGTPPLMRFTVDSVIKAKRGLIFFETKPPGPDGWHEVMAVDVIAWDDDTVPWPKLIGATSHRCVGGQNGPVYPDEQTARGGASAESALVLNQTLVSGLPAPSSADEGRNFFLGPAAGKPTASVTAKPAIPEPSAGAGKVEPREVSRSVQAETLAPTKLPPPIKTPEPINSLPFKPASKTAQVVKTFTGFYQGAKAPRPRVVVFESRVNGRAKAPKR